MISLFNYEIIVNHRNIDVSDVTFSYMSLSAGGIDANNQLGIEPTTKTKNKTPCVDCVSNVPFNISGIKCISSGDEHSVIIKLGNVFAAGDDKTFRIGSASRQVYKTFTQIRITDEPIIWAACGEKFTLYLTENGKAILCHENVKGEKISVKLNNKAVSVFSGRFRGGIVDEDGSILILDKGSKKAT